MTSVVNSTTKKLSSLEVDDDGNLKIAGLGGSGTIGDATNAEQEVQTAALNAIAGALGDQYEPVAAGVTAQVMGASGAAGDYIAGLLCVVSTALTSEVKLKDGSGSDMIVLPNQVGAGIGSYFVPLGLTSTGGAWKVTTGAGVSVIATGRFT